MRSAQSVEFVVSGQMALPKKLKIKFGTEINIEFKEVINIKISMLKYTYLLTYLPTYLTGPYNRVAFLASCNRLHQPIPRHLQSRTHVEIYVFKIIFIDSNQFYINLSNIIKKNLILNVKLALLHHRVVIWKFIKMIWNF